MAVTYTENYNLGKQENHANRFDMKVLTDNADKIDAALAGKIDKETGKGLSANDFTTEEKEKLSGLENYDDTVIKSEAALNRSTLGYQRKNLLKNTAVSQTINGVTFTVNADGSVTANGTATENISNYALNYNFSVGNELMILSGCPTGGSKTSYKIDILDGSGAGVVKVEDFGESAVFNNADIVTGTGIVRFRVQKDTTLSNLVIKPMIRYAEITDDTYEPYKPSVEERLAALEAAVLGGGEA